jgi:hypothetical protein
MSPSLNYLCLQYELPAVLSLFWCQLKKALSCSLHLDLKQMHKMVPVLHSRKPVTLTLCDVLNWNRTKNPISRAHENSLWGRMFSVTSGNNSLCKVYSSKSFGLVKCLAGGRRSLLRPTLTTLSKRMPNTRSWIDEEMSTLFKDALMWSCKMGKWPAFFQIM